MVEVKVTIHKVDVWRCLVGKESFSDCCVGPGLQNTDMIV